MHPKGCFGSRWSRLVRIYESFSDNITWVRSYGHLLLYRTKKASSLATVCLQGSSTEHLTFFKEKLDILSERMVRSSFMVRCMFISTKGWTKEWNVSNDIKRAYTVRWSFSKQSVSRFIFSKGSFRATVVMATFSATLRKTLISFQKVSRTLKVDVQGTLN